MHIVRVSALFLIMNIAWFCSKFKFQESINCKFVCDHQPGGLYCVLRVRTVAKRHMRYSMFTASFILVSCVKLL